MNNEYIPPALTVIAYEDLTDEECEIYYLIVNKALSGLKGRKEK